MLDIAVLVPFQPQSASWVDPTVRGTLATSKLVAIRARDRFMEFLGRPLTPALATRRAPESPLSHRSLTAVVLATSLERAGLRWRVLDPGTESLSEWRKRLVALEAEAPRLVALSSTFIVDGAWLASFCAMVRQILPETRLAVGGYAYATDVKKFLSLDADILCVGEGEVRIVQIAEAARDNHGLEPIRGLYLRRGGGRLRYTGDVAPLRLDELPLPDWSLSSRIDPPVDLEHESIHYTLETQRGCVFKCAFCTYRTLAVPMQGSVERAVAAIRDVASRGRGELGVADATATFPRDRWLRLLRRLVEEGGSSIPITVFARVSDLDDEVCALMAQAGVRRVQIGQESGDQRMLNAMRKGTRVDQVAPAVAAMARNGVSAELLFIFGFPGESEASMAATRRLLETVNDGYAASPVVLTTRFELFGIQDFASVSHRDVLAGVEHRLGWNNLVVSPERAVEAMLRTNIALSRISHAPLTAFQVNESAWNDYPQQDESGRDMRFFHWAKALDRGIGIFAEAEMEGTHPDLAVLRRLREEILAPFPRRPRREVLLGNLRSRIKHRIVWRLASEWALERKAGIGPLTRAAVAAEVWQATRMVGPTLGAVRTGAYPDLGVVSPTSEAVDPPQEDHAAQLVQLGIATGKRKLARAQ
jgi:anaerobic magnesium-protoporphyrin IX monomethyl ester cyclase